MLPPVYVVVSSVLPPVYVVVIIGVLLVLIVGLLSRPPLVIIFVSVYDPTPPFPRPRPLTDFQAGRCVTLVRAVAAPAILRLPVVLVGTKAVAMAPTVSGNGGPWLQRQALLLFLFLVV